MTDEVKQKVEDLNKAFASFKEANDERLKQIEAKGSADSLTEEKVNKINKQISDLQAEVENAVKASTRLQTTADPKNMQKDLEIFAAGFDPAHRPKVTQEEYENYCRGFVNYLRKGDKFADIQAAMSVGSDPNGGYFVPPTVSTAVIKRLFETSPMRSVASIITIGTDAFEYPLDTNDATSGGWVTEQGDRSDTATPTVGVGRIPVHEQYAQPKITQKLLDDAAVDVEGWLSNKIADKIARTENAAFVSGNGVGKPKGFIAYGAAAVTTNDATRAWGKLQYVPTGVSGGFGTSGTAADELIDLVYKLKPAYRNGAIFAMNRSTVAEIRKLKDADGNYLWNMGNIQAGQPQSLLGYGITEFEDMDNIGANTFSIAFGNFKEAYQIVDRQGIRVLRDPYTDKPFIKFYTTKRVGGDVVNFDALKLLKFGTS